MEYVTVKDVMNKIVEGKARLEFPKKLTVCADLWLDLREMREFVAFDSKYLANDKFLGIQVVLDFTMNNRFELEY